LTKRARRDSLLALQRQVAGIVVPAVVPDPVLPSAPVAPRKWVNMAVAGFRAAFTRVGVALGFELRQSGQDKQ